MPSVCRRDDASRRPSVRGSSFILTAKTRPVQLRCEVLDRRGLGGSVPATWVDGDVLRWLLWRQLLSGRRRLSAGVHVSVCIHATSVDRRTGHCTALARPGPLVYDKWIWRLSMSLVQLSLALCSVTSRLGSSAVTQFRHLRETRLSFKQDRKRQTSTPLPPPGELGET